LSASGEAFQQTLVRRKAGKEPMRTKVALGATILLVFLVTTLTLNRFDANVHVTRGSATVPQKQQTDISAPPPDSASGGLTPMFQPASKVAQRIEPKPEAMKSDVGPADPQMAASSTPAADPSTFGSEAYEAIYTN
jgi:hypothetical protein